MKFQLHVNGVPIDPVFDELVGAFRTARSLHGERGWFMASSQLRTYAEVTSPEGTRIQIVPITEEDVHFDVGTIASLPSAPPSTGTAEGS
jgi:hypothetical protein